MAAPVPGPLPPFRSLQSVGSKTFTPPPLDTSLNLPQIFDHHRRKSADHVFYRYEGENGQLQTVTWGRVAKGVHRVAKKVKAVAEASGWNGSDADKPVFAILAAVDSITYVTTIVGVLRAGFVCFPISSRNSPAAIAHLLAKTNSKFIFTTSDAPTAALVEAALAETPEGGSAPEAIASPLFGELYPPLDDTPFEYLEDMEPQPLDAPTLILHSSGSTAFPKPIVQTHRNMIEHLRFPYYNPVDFGDEILAAHGLPPFHAVGVATFCWATSTGLQLGVFRPSSPPIIPTPQKVFEGIVSVGATRVFVVPMFLETWSKDANYVEALKKLRGVIYSGGPMNKLIGDELTAKGVSIRPGYGSTETGFMNTILSNDPMGEDWEYFEFSAHLKPGLLNDGSGAYEMHLIPYPSSTPAVVNTVWEGGPAYSTNDLLVPHPTKANLWKVYGRADDQIMLSTGEKTNPGPIEAILARDPRIHAAIMFGRGRFQNGVLIEPKPQYQFDPSDEAKLSSFREKIWNTVEEANEFAPSHSRIFREMILVAHPDKPFAFTPKGTPKRSVITKDYEAEIEAMYKAVEESSLADIPTPEEWNVEQTRAFAREVIKRVLKAETVNDDDDIFNEHGADSLQVSWIRNAILLALRSESIPVKAIPQNFVYDYPTIGRLSKFIARVVNPPEDGDEKSEIEYKVEEIVEMVEKYTGNFATHVPKMTEAPAKDTVFLSGTTGALGTNVLAELMADPKIAKIYAFNRRSSSGISTRDRHLVAFKDRGVDIAYVDSDRIVYLEGDPALPNFGLSKEMYEEIRDTVTHYIHNAWRVDFNVSLASFEPTVKGVRCIVDTALASPLPTPPRVLFTSSCATLGNYRGTDAVEEGWTTDPALPIGTGYGESKWTSERILAIASQHTTLKPTVFRIGQLSGGSNGAWNAQEWVPAIVKSGQVIKCLPAGTRRVSWLPLNVAGRAIVQMRNSPHPVHHLSHPRTVPWNSLFEPIAKELGVPLVPYDDWLDTLHQSLANASSEMDAVRENPALRLIHFYTVNNADKLPEGKEAGGLPRLSTKLSVQTAPAMTEAQLPQLGANDTLRWIKYWRGVGHLTA